MQGGEILMSIYIIAEAGVNHNGDFATACQLIDAAKAAGADCIKFQTFQAKSIVSASAEKADYQKLTTTGHSQLSMLEQLELPFSAFIELKAYCDSKKIDFLSTPFDLESIAFLDTLDMPFWKIPSGEITNLPYLLAIAQTRKPVVMSTGMSELDEIQAALDVLTCHGTTKVTLLQCNTEYPTPFEDVNLRAMQTMREWFQVDVGYSDHTEGIAIPIAAATLGAAVIEKHFTLDRNMAGPDHKASLEPDELTAMVTGIRRVEKALGDGKKRVSKSEKKNLGIVRKSIVAGCAILEGDCFTESNLAVKRPGTGMNPMRWFEVLGTTAKHDFKKDELIDFDGR